LNVARPENSLEYTSTGELYRGSLIRELRWKKRLSRGRMAKLLGCNPDSLSKVETNGVNPSKQMLSKIAKVLEVPPESFTKAPEHPRILIKKAAQAVAKPQVVSPLASCPSTTPQSSREEVLKLLEAAGVVSDEDLKGFALVKIEDGEPEEEEDQASIVHSAIDIPDSLLGTTRDQIKEIGRLIDSLSLTDEEEEMVASQLDTTERLLKFIAAQRNMQKEG
jgi:transcriptional regulator with XRE-family HTH domain